MMENLSNTFRILGVEARLRIITLLLKSSPLCVNAITDRLDISQSAVSQHLRVLKMAGWVKGEKKGYWVHYSVNRKKVKELRRAVENLTGLRGEKRCRLSDKVKRKK